MKACAIPGCVDRHGRPSRVRARKLCSKHLQRLYRHGDPLLVVARGPAPKDRPRRRWREEVAA